MLRSVFVIAVIGVVALVIGMKWIPRLRPVAQKPVEWPNLKDEWLDVNLPIKAVKQITPGHVQVVTEGIYNGKTLGLTFEFRDIDPNYAFLGNPQGGQLTATPNGVVITSQGEPTANFIKAYAANAKKLLSGLSVPSSLSFTAVTLGGDPQHIATQPSKLKIFHADDQPEGPFYFEAYLNPDIPNGQIEFHEKDPGYREALLRSFGAQF